MPWEPIQPLALAVGDRPSGTPPAGPAVPAAGKSPCTCKIRRYLHFSTALFIILFIIFHWFLWVCHYVFMCLAPSFLPSWGGCRNADPKINTSPVCVPAAGFCPSGTGKEKEQSTRPHPRTR